MEITEVMEITEFTNGGTEGTEDERRTNGGRTEDERRRRLVRQRMAPVRRAGLRSRPADTDESDRDHERLCISMPFMIPIRSVGVRRCAAPVEPPFVLR